jgi:homoaconitase/3-isopropylmalate dehydratase large subunit
MMGTLTEEIFSRRLGRCVHAGDTVIAEVDCAMAHDVTGPLAIDAFRRLAHPLWDARRIVFNFDHVMPANTVAAAEMHSVIRAFCVEHGITNLFAEGICHQVMAEEGFAQPGGIVVGADSHSTTYGAFGCFATGLGSTDIGVVFATGKTWFRVPETIRVNINGQPSQGVHAKDIALHVIKQTGADGADYCAVEWTGETVDAMNIDERMTLCNLSSDFGAKTGLIAPDDVTHAYVRDALRADSHKGNGRTSEPGRIHEESDGVTGRHGAETVRVGPGVSASVEPRGAPLQPQFRAETRASAPTAYPEDRRSPREAADLAGASAGVPPVTTPPDPEDLRAVDPSYARVIDVDASNIRPQVAVHPVIDNVHDIDEMEGMPLDEVFIGSCTNGRLSDLALAAALLEGRVVHERTRTIVVPASRRVYADALRAGYIDTFIQAGALVMNPGCGPCLGRQHGVVGPGENVLSTSNRNYPGRMGSAEARIFLASPSVAAASAVCGAITDPARLQ